MIFTILLSDELRGFYKSKAMVALWVGLPVMTLVLHALQPNAEEVPFLLIAGLLITSLGSAIACVTLSTSICYEMTNHVYDLFLIRPVKRSSLLLAKFLAVLFCVLIASVLAFLTGYLIDAWTIGLPSEAVLLDTLDSFWIDVAGISIASSLGLLIGVLVNSLTVAAIGGLYAGGQLSAVIALVPIMLPNWITPGVFAFLICTIVAPLIMLFTIFIFGKKQL